MAKTMKERLAIIAERDKVIANDIALQIEEKYGFKLDGLDIKINDRKNIITFTKKVGKEKTFILKAVMRMETDFAILRYVLQISYIDGEEGFHQKSAVIPNHLNIGPEVIKEMFDKDNSLAKEWNRKLNF